MADLSGGHLVARTLKQAGVDHVFTLCGGHILPIYDGCLTEDVRVVDMRHEQAAAHAADAYARLTRNIGVAVVTAGPGVTDAVTGVANAHSARSPLLLIGGAAPLGLRGLGALQETEQVALLRPITKAALTVTETRQIPEVLTAAIRTALTGRPGPVFVEIAVDLLMALVEDRLAPIPTGYVHRSPAAADPESVAALAALVAGARRPVVMAGSGVYWDGAAAELQAFAEAAGVPVFMNGAGRGCLPSDHPQAFSQARGMALGRADLVLVLGTPLDFRLGYGRPPTFAEDAQVAMVDADPTELGRNRPLALGLAGHIGLVLRQLREALPAAMGARFGDWMAALRAKEAESQARLMLERQRDGVPISHYRLAHELAAVVDRETTVVGDGGDVVGCAAKIVPLHRPGQWLDPGPFGCLGVGPSFAIAAKLLRPEHRVLLLAGDGAFGLNGMELETAVRFKLPMTVVVGNDGGWGQIRNPQLSFFGAERAVGTSLPFTRYDLLVEAMGGKGIHVTDPRHLRPALERALGSGEVYGINVELDPAAYRRTGQVSMAI
ncbi:MAG: thiamine pyrophosphate-dependent enzyme [Candidatus Rokubacteria bacterium]|nr:thiamine pyrophosphate-dependent enzyme [Candidatus Rokubacteria bacterium]